MSEQPEFQERSENGDPIYRHQSPEKRDWTPAISETNLAIFSQHVETHVGKIETVYHEILSDLVHIDVHIVAPAVERPYYTFITSGMSDIPMAAPNGKEFCRFAELMLCLPASWPIKDEDWKQDVNFWPIRGLKWLARFPHQYKTWLWLGHTIANGNPPEPFAPNTKANCWMLAQPLTVSTEFWKLRVDDSKTIHFFSILPLFQDEADLKLKKGSGEIMRRFQKAKYSEIINLSRKNVAVDPWWKIF